jgi:hypothetical protein
MQYPNEVSNKNQVSENVFLHLGMKRVLLSSRGAYSFLNTIGNHISMITYLFLISPIIFILLFYFEPDISSTNV